MTPCEFVEIVVLPTTGCIGLASAWDCAYSDLFCVGAAERGAQIRLSEREHLLAFHILHSYESSHLINDKCVSIEMTRHDTMSLSLSQQRHHNRLGLSLSKSGHGMVHLLLIVNPSPSLQFLRDPGLVSHTLSPCCLNNKPLTPRLELRYMTILTAR